MWVYKRRLLFIIYFSVFSVQSQIDKQERRRMFEEQVRAEEEQMALEQQQYELYHQQVKCKLM